MQNATDLHKSALTTAYSGYFETERGEKNTFSFDWKKGQGLLIRRADGKQATTYQVLDGKVPGLSLSVPEQLWLRICWNIANRLRYKWLDAQRAANETQASCASTV